MTIFQCPKHLNENGGQTRYKPTHNFDSDVFLSVEVPSLPMQSENVSVNA